MPGDFSRFSDNANKRFSALYMQQGRVQLDADWNESVEILRRRMREVTQDIVGRSRVPHATTPNGFQIVLASAGTDLTIEPGRIYVDGILAECFSTDGSNGGPPTYSSQPFMTGQPALSTFTSVDGGDVLVYLDVWEREITSVEDSTITDSALNGVDTGTRLQTVWQVKVTSLTSGCTSDFSSLFPPSGGRLTTGVVAPSQAPDPCSLPGAGGYQGVDNRLYRVEVHDATNNLFKWSRDNGSVATTISTLVSTSTNAQIVVASLGRDDDLGFHVNDWVEVTDDLRDLGATRLAGMMAQITFIDIATRTITVDRPLVPVSPQPAFSPTGANGLRVRRWDQTTGLSTIGGTKTGLVAAVPNAQITLENGIYVTLDVASGGTLQVGDAWVFAARSSTGAIDDSLTSAPPIAIRHHYCSLAWIQGLGSSAPIVTDCRILGDGCSCTECVSADQHNAGTFTIQDAIDRLATKGGGVVCLGTGTFDITTTISLSGFGTETASYGGNIELRGAGPATILSAALPTVISVSNVDGIAIRDLQVQGSPPPATSPPSPAAMTVGIDLSYASDVSIERCSFTVFAGGFGVGINLDGYVSSLLVRDNEFRADYGIGSFSLDDSVPASPAEDAASLYASYVDISTNNFYYCGIAIYGTSNYLDGFAIERNTIINNGAQPAISIYGATDSSSPVRIVGNVIEFYGQGARGIDLACDDTFVCDNLIQSYATSGAGVYIGDTSSSLQVRCRIERNQIAGYPYETGNAGVYLNASQASRITIRGNTITGFDAGIYTSLTASSDDLVIEGNDLLNIGDGNPATTLPYGFIGIFAADSTRAIVRDNTISNLGTAATTATAGYIAGVLIAESMATPSASVVVTNNEIKNVGSSQSGGTATKLVSTFGVLVTGSFDRARVSQNRINFQHTAHPLSFAGISLSGNAGTGNGQQDVDVSSNTIDAVLSSTALLGVDVVGSCALRGNSVAIIGTPANAAVSPPAGVVNEVGIQVTANTLIASDNQVNVYGLVASISPPSGWGMQLTVTRPAPFTNLPSVTILGNICTTGIGLAWTTPAGTMQQMVPLVETSWQAFNVVS